MALPPAIIQRLALIKFLYKRALETSQLPEPASVIALLSFHDAAEWFLELAAEHLDAPPSQAGKKNEFAARWESLNQKISPRELVARTGMNTLNRARADLKHHGLLPNRLSLESYRETTNSFFHENTPILFGLEFSDISLLEFVQPAEAREEIGAAALLEDQRDFIGALTGIEKAFRLMLKDYKNRKRDLFGRNPFSFGENLTFVRGKNLRNRSGTTYVGSTRHTLSGHNTLNTAKLAEYIDDLAATVRDLQGVIEIIALGIDYRKYTRFRHLSSEAKKIQSGWYSEEKTALFGVTPPTKEDCQFCRDFVIEGALALMEFDYSLVPRLIRRPEVSP